MSVREHVSPWFLDEPRSALAALAHRGARIGTAMPAAGPAASAIVPLHREIAAFTERCVRGGEVPVSIAGDCCAAIPVLAGLQRGGVAPTLVWLDAHGDFNTHATSPSGFLGGMPLAMLAGHGERGLVDALGAEPVPEGRIHLADARDLDAEEAEALARSDVTVADTLEDLLAGLPDGASVHVHFDCDVIDSREVPAQAYPVPGGPSGADVARFFRALADTVDVVAVSLCAWHPELDVDGRSEARCLACLDALLERL